MKTLPFFVIFIALFFYHDAKSQVYRGSGIKYSVGAETGLAVNYLAKNYESLLGISLQVDFPILEGELYATVNTGFNNVFVRSSSLVLEEDMHVLPLKTGLKYFFRKLLYAQTDVGVSFLLNKTNCVEGRKNAFVLAPQFGAILPINRKHAVDIGLRFESTGKFYACDTQNNFVGMRIAWSFMK